MQSGKAQAGSCRDKVNFMAHTPISATMCAILCTEEKAMGMEEQQQALHVLSQEQAHFQPEALY